jgi:hypothetical protein
MTNPSDTCPAEILEWIAWYPDGGLDDAQRGAVEAHAASCAACREEIAVLAGRLEPPVAPADPERLFARVLALVEADRLGAGASAPAATPAERATAAHEPAAALPERASAPAARPAQPAPRRAAPGLRRSFVSSGGRTRLAAGVALAMLAGGLGGWLGRDWLRPDAVYALAGETPPLAAQGAVALDVVFRSDASAERIQTALRGLGAEVAAGPSPLGRYRIELPPGADASAAAALLRAEGTGVASFAEPLRP